MMTAAKKIDNGLSVTMHYTITLVGQDHIADSTRDGEPIQITIGSGDIIEGLENCLLGLKAGDRQQFEIPCRQAYGPANSADVHAIARDEFPDNMKIEPGSVVGFTTAAGQEIAGTVQEMDDNHVMINFCHPLAGFDLMFDVEIINVTG